MNVFNNPNIQRLSRIVRAETEPNPKVKLSPAIDRSGRQDSVKLSDEARIFAAFRQQFDQLPSVRWDKVEALRKAIAEGSYHVPAEELAEALLREGKLV